MSPILVDSSSIRKAFSAAGIGELPLASYDRFAVFLELLLRWNSRWNLTAVREAGDIIDRHFVESAFAAQQLPAGLRSLLDYGSGAGFPGIPIAICRPEIHVTLAEAQSKKAAFLREAVRVLGIASGVYAGRVESMPAERRFDAVTMRAVEKMEKAIPVAARRAEHTLALLIGEGSLASYQRLAPDFSWGSAVRLPNTARSVLVVGARIDVAG